MTLTHTHTHGPGGGSGGAGGSDGADGSRGAPVGEKPYDDTENRDGPPEFLVLDIGGDVGALILYADATCLGMEIDLSPIGAPRSHHTHTMIRRRRTAMGEMVAGVYPELTAGTYTVWGIDGDPLGQVTISGGRVAEFRAGQCLRASL